jgi:beta-glucosidase
MRSVGRLCYALAPVIPMAYGQPQKPAMLPYQNSHLQAEQRITDLLDRMSLNEKLVMLGTDPTVPRLGIVGTNHVEGLHGLAQGGPGGWGGRGLVTPTTQFPQARGRGQTWDPDLLREAATEDSRS